MAGRKRNLAILLIMFYWFVVVVGGGGGAAGTRLDVTDARIMFFSSTVCFRRTIIDCKRGGGAPHGRLIVVGAIIVIKDCPSSVSFGGFRGKHLK